ncbi:hypothetical protein [Brevundimonas sp.]|jgi:hypothetical protein|uniref:hypothetical protein n=1 Tax=Brevundimonas sp. TaxID=1871086 RepID=UPI003783C64F
MQRIPVVVFNNIQLTTAVAGATSPVPDATTLLTISAATINNTTPGAVTMDAYIVPSGGTAGAANQVISALSIPAAGAAPTILAGLIGQTVPAGGTLQLKASAATSLTPFVSGYRTTL